MNLKELTCIENNINLEEYITYREEVKSHMEHPDWLGDFSKEDLTNLLETGSKIWMYFKDNEFVCSMMLIPSDEKSLKKFNVEKEVNEVADYGPMFVNIKYIGNHLQYQMLKEIDEYSKTQGYKYALSTIHPDNIFSINNLVKDEFEKIGYIELKRGPRNIYLKKLI